MSMPSAFSHSESFGMASTRGHDLALSHEIAGDGYGLIQ